MLRRTPQVAEPRSFITRQRRWPGYAWPTLRTLLFAVLAVACGRVPALAQEPPQAASPGLMHRLWGTAEPSAIYLGMWTRHLTHAGIDNNHAYGGTIRGVFGGTFINSYHSRSYALALERRVAARRLVGTDVSVGYRLGAIQGYDRRLLPIAGTLPVVPFVAIVGGATVKGKVGLQASFCVKVVTWNAVVRF